MSSRYVSPPSARRARTPDPEPLLHLNTSLGHTYEFLDVESVSPAPRRRKEDERPVHPVEQTLREGTHTAPVYSRPKRQVASNTQKTLITSHNRSCSYAAAATSPSSSRSRFNPRASHSVRFSGEADVLPLSHNYDEDAESVEELGWSDRRDADFNMNSTFSTTTGSRQGGGGGGDSTRQHGNDPERAELPPRSYSAMSFRSAVGVDDLPASTYGDWWSTVPHNPEAPDLSPTPPLSTPPPRSTSPDTFERGNLRPRPRPHSVAGIRSTAPPKSPRGSDGGGGGRSSSSRSSEYWFRRPPHTELKESMVNQQLHEQDLVERFNYRNYYERSSSPWTDELVRLRAQENALLDRKNLIENVAWLRENRGPAPRWYEWRTAAFNEEMRRNTRLEQRKHAWTSMWEQTRQLQHKLIPSKQ